MKAYQECEVRAMGTTISTGESKRRTLRPPHAQLEAIYLFNPRPVPCQRDRTDGVVGGSFQSETNAGH